VPVFTHQRRGTVDVGRQIALTILALFGVIVIGTLGYRVLGIGWLDALYATVYTVTTVGFHDVEPSGTAVKVFTIVLMLFGIGLVLYTLTLLTASLIEGHIGSLMGRRRMQREIDALSRHTIVCGYGRVGKATAHELHRAGRDVVVVDVSEERLADCPYPSVLGNASSDHVLRQAGIDRASTLVATLDTDADSLYVTLSARAINADLMIIARSRTDDAEKKFTRAGADRVVNPQRLGGDRIAAFARQPHVVDFLDVALQRDEDSDREFLLEDVTVRSGSGLVGVTVSDIGSRVGDGPLVLALRTPTGSFVTNPPGDQVIGEGDVLIVVGTVSQVEALRSVAHP
jgi:voltage-gated potassium channel